MSQKSNRECKAQLVAHGIERCERCGGDWILTIAHRHKRRWYSDDPANLWKWEQFLLLCLKCHTYIEYDRKRTAKLFLRLRGGE